MPKTNVSRAIARLEHSLGTRLFQRTTREVGLTPRARRYLIGVAASSPVSWKRRSTWAVWADSRADFSGSVPALVSESCARRAVAPVPESLP